MSTYPDPLLTRLNISRVAHLHTLLCLKDFRLEVSFAVAPGQEQNRPQFFLETLNVVLTGLDKAEGDGAPSACLVGGDIPEMGYDPKSRTVGGDFKMHIDFPAARPSDSYKIDPRSHVHGPPPLVTSAKLEARILGELEPKPYGGQTMEMALAIEVPEEIVQKLQLQPVIEIQLLLPFFWFFLAPRRTLAIQPVFISPDGATPATGSDFYPLLARANEIWAKCCIEFHARCPIYIDEQQYRISTQAEAVAFKDEVNVDDAIEVFMLERLDPETTWGGGATFSSGTSTAKIVTGDNQLPGNDNHLAHELGHVLGLGHPGAPNGLVDSCVGSVMEPSGFFADNPSFQCQFNCSSAANPLLTSSFYYHFCIQRLRPNQELF